MRALMVIFSFLFAPVVLADYCVPPAPISCTLPGWRALAVDGKGGAKEAYWHYEIVFTGTDQYGFPEWEYGLVGYEYPGDLIHVGNDFTPLVTPSEGFWFAQLQAAAAGEGPCGDVSCLIQGYVHDKGAFIALVGGWIISHANSPLNADHDGDGVINLLDPDARVVCSEDPDAPCTSPFDLETGLPWESSGPGGGGEFLPETEIPGLPYVSGDQAHGFGCDMVLAWGGSAYPYDTALSFANNWVIWGVSHWRSQVVFGRPVEDKPYSGAFNLVRGGEGGGISAYFSAVWGKELCYLDGNNTSDKTTMLRTTTTLRWHRYVVFNNRVWFQYWRPSDSCWAPIGVSVYTVTGGGIASRSIPDYYQPPFEVRNDLDWGAASELIPEGYFPGDVMGETESNVTSGEYYIPPSVVGTDTYLASWWGAPQAAAAPGSGGGSGSGSSLSAKDIESAFSTALRGSASGVAAAGANAIGAMLDSGGDSAVVGLFGSGYDGAGLQGLGAVGTAGEGFASAAGEAFGQAGQGGALQGLGGSQGLQFAFAVPRPGGGPDIEWVLSTLPDTSTAMGAVFETARVTFRVLLSFLCVWKFLLACINVMKE